MKTFSKRYVTPFLICPRPFFCSVQYLGIPGCGKHELERVVFYLTGDDEQGHQVERGAVDASREPGCGHLTHRFETIVLNRLCV